MALDLPGFGLSDPGERPATVPANVLVLESFVRHVADGPVVLVGNSMGGMISILLAARTPDLVRGLVLLDPALPPPLSGLQNVAVGTVLLAHALPGVGEQLLWLRARSLGPRALVHGMLRLCGVDPAALPPELVGRSVALAEQRADVAGMDRAFLSASRSLTWVLTWARPYRAAMSSITVPVLLVQGASDRLVPVAAARETARRHPPWRYVELPGVGHVPQLQVPRTGWPRHCSTGSRQSTGGRRTGAGSGRRSPERAAEALIREVVGDVHVEGGDARPVGA